MANYDINVCYIGKHEGDQSKSRNGLDNWPVIFMRMLSNYAGFISAADSISALLVLNYQSLSQILLLLLFL